MVESTQRYEESTKYSIVEVQMASSISLWVERSVSAPSGKIKELLCRSGGSLDQAEMT